MTVSFLVGFSGRESARDLTNFAPRVDGLARDYATMEPMFIGMPIEFDVMLQRLQTSEQQLNDGRLLRPA